MNIFAILGVDSADKVSAFIEINFPSNFIKIQNGEWFIASGKTTEEIAALFLKEGGGESSPLGSFIVIPVLNYNGWYISDAWEWIDSKSKEVAVKNNG